MINSSALQKGEIIKAVETSVHRKVKEGKIMNILPYKNVQQVGAKPGFRIWKRIQHIGRASTLLSVQAAIIFGSIASYRLPWQETLADLQRNCF